MESSSIALLISGYSALVATVAVVWNLLNYLRDKASLKIKATLVSIETNAHGVYAISGPELANPTILVRVVNSGRRPIDIQGLKIRLEDGSTRMVAACKEKLPHTLTESKGMDFSVLPGTFSLASSVAVVDSAERLWPISTQDFEAIRKEERRFVSQS